MTVATMLATPTGFAPDLTLPSRDTLLSEREMADLLGRYLKSRVTACRRIRTKYRVGESLRVLYKVTHEFTGTSHLQESLVSIRSFSEPGRPEKEADALVIPELNAALWVYPNDRKLKQLAWFVNEPSAATSITGVAVTKTELVAYAPEKAATFRCLGPDGVVAYVKLYAGGIDVQAAALYRQLAPALEAEGIIAPRLLRHDTSVGSVALRVVAGEPLADPQFGLEHWRGLGRSLAALHQLPAPVRSEPFPRVTTDWVNSSAMLIGAARPDLAYDVARLADDLVRTRPESDASVGVLHGDVHGKNVLVDRHRSHGDQVGFVDLDQVGLGVPAVDLGSAIAALRAAGTDRSFEQALLDGYRIRGDAPPASELAWHVSSALLTERSLRAVNRVRLDSLADLDRLVGLSFAALDEVRP